MKSLIGSIVMLSVAGAFLAIVPVASQRAVVDLGTLPDGSFSGAFAINNRGDVAGFSTGASGETHATLWRDGGIINLGTLPCSSGNTTMVD